MIQTIAVPLVCIMCLIADRISMDENYSDLEPRILDERGIMKCLFQNNVQNNVTTL